MKQNLDELLKNYKQNLEIIGVSQKNLEDINLSTEFQSKFRDKTVFKTAYFNNFSMGFLFKEDWDKIFEELKKVSLSSNKKILFIIFNEYFFGKQIFDKNNKEILFNIIKKYFNETINLKFIFIFINLLVEENPIDPKNMIIYTKDITIFGYKLWSSSDKFDIKYEDQNSKWYSNTTYILYNGNPILSYKKSSFADEGIVSNYIFGSGKFEILSKIPESNSIQNFINLHICMDFTVKPYFSLIKELNCDFCGDAEIRDNFNNLKNYLLNNTNNNDFEKEINIIISNTISINVNNLFKNNSLLVQVDPENNFVCEIKFSKYLEKVLELAKEKHEKLIQYYQYKHIDLENENPLKKLLIFELQFNYFQLKKSILEGNSLGCVYPKKSQVSILKINQGECFMNIYNLDS